jgi:hypothetical protein
MSTDAQTLLSEAKCYICLGVSLAEALELALLAQIVNGGGGGGGGTSVTSGAGAPAFVPTTSVAIYFDENTGVQYNWYSGAWH